MIGYLRGKLTIKTPTYLIVECQGVGYHVNTSLQTYSQVEKLDEALIYTHMMVREDDMSLYGFFEEEERRVFQLLISVNGIGANTGRVILSYMTTEEIQKAIIHEDVISISKVKGIGPKTAKRIILDLKDKIIKESGIEAGNVPVSNNMVKNEALSALIALGFPKATVEKALKSIFTSNPTIDSVEDVIKLVLKQMS